MSKRSATDTIKSLNSDNKSGAIKQALDLIKQLEQSKAGETNPEAMSAMGAGNVAGMLKGLAQMMQGGGKQGGSQQQQQEDDKKRLEELEELQRQIEEVDQALHEQPEPQPTTESTTPTINFSRTARYIRWTITQTKGSNGVQAAEFVLLANGEPVVWPEGTTVTNLDGNNPIGEEPENLIDGNPATKWSDTDFTHTSEIVIDTQENNSVTFDSYYYVTANDQPLLDPTGWSLETSNNGIIWKIADGRMSVTITNERLTDTQIFNGSD